MKCKGLLLLALLLMVPVLALAEVHTVENDALQLSIDSQTLALTVTDKATGHMFSSVVDPTGTGANKTWTAFLSSTLVVEVAEGTAVTTKQYTLSSSGVEVAFTPLENGADAVVDFTELGQTITLQFRLEGDSLVVTIPADGLKEYTVSKGPDKNGVEQFLDTKLCGVYLMPNFGATLLDEKEGYILVPEAAGALIDFSNGEGVGSTPFKKRIYGTNIGVDKSVMTELNRPAEQITLPVYGMAYTSEQLAYLAVLEQGEEAAEIEAYPAGVITKFNRAMARFTLREQYIAQTTRSTGLSSRESKAWLRDMSIRFYILTGEDATYAGMARRYREALEAEGSLNQADTAYHPRLDFLGAESAQFLLWNSVEKMTTVEQMGEILDTWREEGLTAPLVLYRGWQPGGLTWAYGSGSTKLEGKLGSEQDLISLMETVRENGGRFYLEIDPVQANPDRMYNMSVDVVRTIGQTVAEIQTGKDLYPTLYYLTPNRTSEILTDLVKKWGGYADGVALSILPNTLYSYYSRGGNHSRGETMAAYLTTLESLDTSLALDNPLAGYFGQMEIYLDMPLDTTSYSFLSAEVPFLPLVISGEVPYYSTWLNFESNTQHALLKLVEYGAYPSWLITGEDVQPLIYTNSSDVFTAQWSVMLGKVLETDAELKALHEQLDGAAMVDHTRLAEDVVCATYANGVRVYVNYRRTDYTADGLTIPALGYLVEGGDAE